ncbi:MAG: hypothetical protein V3U62_03215, partial [Sedimenticolaceae bacterium]
NWKSHPCHGSISGGKVTTCQLNNVILTRGGVSPMVVLMSRNTDTPLFFNSLQTPLSVIICQQFIDGARIGLVK